MKKQGLTELLIFIVSAELTGALSALLSGGYGFFGELIKPPLSPPAAVFPVAWTILYALMGISAYLVFSSNAGALEKQNALRLYIFQLALNFSWSIIFFRFRMPLLAAAVLIVLLVTVIVMTANFRRIRPIAGYLNIPYIVWLCFAAYLNIGTVLLN